MREPDYFYFFTFNERVYEGRVHTIPNDSNGMINLKYNKATTLLCFLHFFIVIYFFSWENKILF